MRPVVFLFLTLVVPGFSASAQLLVPQGELQLLGGVVHSDQLSGITFFRDFLVVCPDEEASFNVLKRLGPDSYTVTSKVKLLSGDGVEIDLEGAASDATHLYLVGSHSLARKKVESDRTYEKNRKRLVDVDEHEGADSLFRLTLDDEGNLATKDRISLRDILKADKLLKAFTKIPSKENGVDIEGVAIKNEKVFLGFRGPVLRENFVPVMVLQFDEPEDYELRFVKLDGRGIRDITAVDDGFLIIGGPIGDGTESYMMYFWNGKDCIPGEESPGGIVSALGTIPSTGTEKPEGIVVTSNNSQSWDVVIVCDGKEVATKFHVPKP